jgi:hypothetical protein
MKTSTFMLVLAGIIAIASTTLSQSKSTDEPVVLNERNLGGPRLGITFLSGGGELTDKIHRANIGRILSQFGWHFEYQVVPSGGGPSFVVQFVPMAGGVEYGTIIPSASLAMGIRFPEGIEFGLGPNILVSSEGASTSLVVALGKSFNYGGVSIPLNFVVATNPGSTRISVIFGYAIAKATNR